MFVVSDSEFESLVATALDDLPADFSSKMCNVEVVVEGDPSPTIQSRFSGSVLLGLYQGQPLNRRSVHHSGSLPDRISLFKNNIERICQSRQDLSRQIQKTLLHEIGHHFGLNERELRSAGY